MSTPAPLACIAVLPWRSRHDTITLAAEADPLQGQKVNLSEVVAGQKVGVTQIGERVWLVTFMRCDVGSFDDETFRLERIDNTSRNSARSAGVSSVSSPHPSY